MRGERIDRCSYKLCFSVFHGVIVRLKTGSRCDWERIGVGSCQLCPLANIGHSISVLVRLFGLAIARDRNTAGGVCA